MTSALVERPALDAKVIESVLLGGDLSKLSADQRIGYYNRVCESLGLNPLTQPFAYIRLNGREVLYAKKDCTEQLRAIHNISIDPKGFAREVIEGCYIVTAPASMPSGRTDVSTGAVPIEGLKGEARANAMMKAETKAKRRVTLSICGLGMLDETEIETVRADPPVVRVDAPQALPAAPEGAVYIVSVEPKRKGEREWAEVTFSTGEIALAVSGQQLVALCEQIAQEHAPAVVVTKVNKKDKTEIVSVARWKADAHLPPVAPLPELTADEFAF